MSVLMGPVLGFRSGTDSKWCVSVLYVVSDDTQKRKLHVDDGTATWDVENPKILMSFQNKDVIRFDVDVGRASDTAKTVRYFFHADAGKTFAFEVPMGKRAINMAYGSCNGFSDDKLANKIADQNERWKHLAATHASKRYHLMLLGGDQVYSDAMWVKVDTLKEWLKLPAGTDPGERFDPAKLMEQRMHDEVETFYFNTYVERWRQVEPAAVFASIPSLMIWDDHDIFDGWGSYPKDQQNCPVYDAIFKIAHRHFAVFQQQIGPGESPAGAIAGQGFFNAYHQIGAIGILMLDMRSERTSEQVISEPTWNAIYAGLEKIEIGALKHLFVMSSIPVVHPDFGAVESVFGMLPGQQELEDDLRDHWHSRPHKIERVRLIHRLFKFASEKSTRITILSGDVHVAAVGVLESTRADFGNGNASVINQLTSSAIVHPAPTQLMALALDFLSRAPEVVDRGIEATMVAFPGTSRRYVLARNWLGLEPDDVDDRIWANWYVENEKSPYSKVIHPV